MKLFILLIQPLVAVIGTCPFQDKYACLKYDTDIKIAKLQATLDHVLKQTQKKDDKIARLERSSNEIQMKMIEKDHEIENKIKGKEQEILKTVREKDNKILNELRLKNNQMERDLKNTRDKLDMEMNHLWTLTRIDMQLPKMTGLKLNKQTPTIHEKFPLPFPKRTRAIIVSLTSYTFYTRAVTTLIGTIGQRGNIKGATQFRQGYVTYVHTSQELFVPWVTDGLQELEIKVTDCIHSGSNNYFTFKVTGYVTA